MSYRVRCYTLFDITQTGVLPRRQPINLDEEKLKQWIHSRNTQSNYDTILQVVSLRSQPENHSAASKIEVNFNEFKNFGFLFDEEENQPCWYFDFSIAHKSVFTNGITEFGALDNDCSSVPMIKTETAWTKLPAFLDTTPELRNIYFEVISDDE